MCTIEIDNVHSRLVNASTRAIMSVDNALAVATPGAEFTDRYRRGMWDGKTHFFSVITCKFPTGLMSEVMKALKKVQEPYELADNRESMEYTIESEVVLQDYKLGSITLRDYQYDAVMACLKATRGIVNIATNGGKTEVACGLMKCVLPKLAKGQRIAFFTSSKEIFSQTKNRIEERLGRPVGVVGDGEWNEQDITVVMIPTISKYISKPKELPKTKKLKELQQNVSFYSNRKDCKAELKKAQEVLAEYEKEQWTDIKKKIKTTKTFLESIYMMIGDEVHHASSTSWYDVFMKLPNAYYKFGLTGTVDESNEINVKRLMACTGRITAKVSNDFLIEKGYSAKPTICMLTIDAPDIDDVLYPIARKLGIIHNDVRNKVFVNKIIEEAKGGSQCLVIVNETEHGQVILEMLQQHIMGAELIHGELSNKTRQSALNRLKSGQLRVLVSTPILDEGVDVAGINCLFLMAGGKSMRQLLQRIGRGLRKKSDGSGVKVYDALDYHNEYLADHTSERYTTYKAEGFDVVKL